MVQAARGLVPVMADCTQGNHPHKELMQRFGVRGFPTVLFLDPNGNKVEELGSRDPAGVRGQIERVVQQHARPTVSDMSIADGLALAREQKKLLAVAFMEPQGQESAAFLELVMSPQMEAVRGRFHWIRRPATGERNRPTDEAKELGVRKPPALVILDPWAEGDARELKKLTAFRSLKRDLEKALEEAQKRGHPPADAPPAADDESE
ncbi:MAG: hypothetical protein M9894_11160 [Planctomycetes bacterium]|nr:hypothetical protein [Planctomycetota bacterium]